MPLFWIVHDDGKHRRVFIAEAQAMLFARLEAMFAKHPGDFVEGLALDGDSVGKVPKKLVGRTLTEQEVAELLDRFG